MKNINIFLYFNIKNIRKIMLKNKIMLLAIFSALYCANASSMEESTGFDLYSLDEPPLVRQKGYWTKKQDLSPVGHSKIFYTPIEDQHQREDWYQKTKYIAEPWCTVTNVPLLLVAHYFKSQKPIAASALAFAGSASAVSHAIPRQWLNVVDRIGAFTAVAGVAYDCNLHDPKTLMNALTNPAMVVPAIAMGLVKYADRRLAHDEYLLPMRKKYQTIIHNLWHLIAAGTAFVFLLYATR
jgi:hypothetical protein